MIPDSVNNIQISLSEVSIALALPMLSLVFATTSVVALASTFYFLYADDHPIQSRHIAAMSVGVYAGGTPNLAAIKSGLGISNDLYLLFHSFDTLLSRLYMLFMVSFAIPLFRWLLPAPDTVNKPAISYAANSTYQVHS